MSARSASAACGLCALGLAGLLAAGVPVARGQSAVYRVAPGDVLAVEVHAGGDRQDDYAVTVSASGTITCPLIGELAVADSTTPAIERRIADALARGYYVEPHVQVSVREVAGNVSIVGEVQHPGAYPTRAALTLLGACDLAGGLTDFAAPRRLRLYRLEDGRRRLYTLDLVRVRQGRADDVPLRSGDRVEIPRRWF